MSGANVCSPAAFASPEFQAVEPALISGRSADRACLRRWVLRWIGERGHQRPEAEPCRIKSANDVPFADIALMISRLTIELPGRVRVSSVAKWESNR